MNEEWRKYFVHRTSCGCPIYDEVGEVVIYCGDDLGGFWGEFAQCPKCVQKDIESAEEQLKQEVKGE